MTVLFYFPTPGVFGCDLDMARFLSYIKIALGSLITLYKLP